MSTTVSVQVKVGVTEVAHGSTLKYCVHKQISACESVKHENITSLGVCRTMENEDCGHSGCVDNMVVCLCLHSLCVRLL